MANYAINETLNHFGSENSFRVFSPNSRNLREEMEDYISNRSEELINNTQIENRETDESECSELKNISINGPPPQDSWDMDLGSELTSFEDSDDEQRQRNIKKLQKIQKEIADLRNDPFDDSDSESDEEEDVLDPLLEATIDIEEEDKIFNENLDRYHF